MINFYRAGDPEQTLHCDLASEHPIYIYICSDRLRLIYSKNLPVLIQTLQKTENLTLNASALAFLLQSGVPAPNETIFNNLLMLQIGDSATLRTVDGNASVKLSHRFPFANELRPEESPPPDAVRLLELLQGALEKEIHKDKPTFLFHSSGKDSNTLLLALAEMRWQDRVTLVTQASEGETDESAVASRIARKFGFSHQILHQPGKLTDEQKQASYAYFRESPFPSVDNVTLAYPSYPRQIPELKGANLIDGMGNDVYVGHVPSRREYRRQRNARVLAPAINSMLPGGISEGWINRVGKTRIEYCGFSGFSGFDAAGLIPGAPDARVFWHQQDTYADYLDLRSAFRGCLIDQEMFTRKIRNFADVTGSNLILPWCNAAVAQYCFQHAEEQLFDRKALRNKVFLRDLLRERMDLDVDALGKKIFMFDRISFIRENWSWVQSEIRACNFWDPTGVQSILKRLERNLFAANRNKGLSARLVYRLLVLSLWLNHSRYSERVLK